MPWLQFVVLGIVAACVYGIVHDQVTARVCVEYFTLGHAPLFATESPTLLGIGWGVVASWWGGAILGLGLAAAARSGNRPKVDANEMVRPVFCLLVVMATSAILAGISGYWLAITGRIQLTGRIALDVPSEKHPYFLADMWAQATWSDSWGAGYSLSGFGGGGSVLSRMIWE